MTIQTTSVPLENTRKLDFAPIPALDFPIFCA